MHIIFVYNSKCVQTALNKLLNNNGLIELAYYGIMNFLNQKKLLEPLEYEIYVEVNLII